MGSILRIGTRKSQLALVQAQLVADLLRSTLGVESELIGLRTTGDRSDAPFSDIEGSGFFTKEIERAVLDGSVDLAVHSLKDLATEQSADLQVSAVLERADPRDALLLAAEYADVGGRAHGDPVGTGDFGELAEGATVGTGSLRRRAFLARLRPDLSVKPLRGNVPTRIKKLHAGHYDAIILAAAGLDRLGLEDHISYRLSETQFLPAPGQGAIAVQTRADAFAVHEVVGTLNHLETSQAVAAERGFLRRIEGGCLAPAGAIAHVQEGRVRVSARVCSADGTRTADGWAEGPAVEAASVGEAAGERAADAGGREILDEIRSAERESRSGSPEVQRG
jgi:hydroxymethylbilane synthase